MRRRLGREALERVAQPLVGGIYTADPERLSLAATMPRFLALEREHRSLILGLRRTARAAEAAGASGARWSLFVTLAGGMEELVTALAARLPAGAVRLGTARGRRRADVGRAGACELSDGAPLPADGVVLAGPAPGMARLVRARGRLRWRGSSTGSRTPRRRRWPSPIRGRAIRHPLDGFGFVVPRVERRATLACTFSSVKYPGRAPDGFALLRVFVGGALQGDLLAQDDRAPRPAGARRRRGAPRHHGRARASPACGGTRGTMPQYDVGHLDRVAAIESRLEALPGLALAGGAYRGVGIADCVRSGEAAAERLTSSLKGR